MATKIVTKNSSTANAVPAASDLVQGELAVNVADKRLFTEDNGGSIVELGTKPSTIDINAGSIDGTAIGASSASTGAFTTLTATGLTVNNTTAFSYLPVSTAGSVVGTIGTGSGTIFNTPSVNASYGSGLAIDGSYSSDVSTINLKAFGPKFSSYSSQLVFHTSSGTSLAEHMRIDGGGNAIFTKSGGAYLQLKDASAVRGAINVTTSDGLVFTTGSSFTERMRITDTGVGIGTSSPVARLEVHGAFPFSGTVTSLSTSVTKASARIRGSSDASTSLYFGSLGNDAEQYIQASNGAGSAADDIALNPYGGNVGIGTSAIMEDFGGGRTTLALKGTGTADYSTLQLGNYGTSSNGQIHGLINFYDGTTSVSRIQSVRASNTSDAHLAFYTAPSSGGITERMRIDSSGTISTHGISGRSSGSVGHLSISEQSNNRSYVETSTTTTSLMEMIAFLNPNGKVGKISISGSATNYVTSSDYRLKENVVKLTGATERLKQLNPSRFNFIADADTTVDGFLAHEVADVVPEAISGEKDAMMDEDYEVTPEVLDDEGSVITEAVMGTRSVPDYQGIDQSKLVPLLVATIQELEARITQLENN